MLEIGDLRSIANNFGSLHDGKVLSEETLASSTCIVSLQIKDKVAERASLSWHVGVKSEEF